MRLGKRGIAVTGLLVWMCLFGPAASARAGTWVQNVTLSHDGITRYFDYYVPDGLPATPVPLLFVLHGGTQSNKLLPFSAYVEMQDIADDEAMILVQPNGTDPTTGLSGPNGNFNWNDCRADAGGSTTTADDVGFIGALIDWAAGAFAIDLDRVYATGPSNGGLMSYRLAFDLSDRIAAIAAVIANLPADSECAAAPSQPRSVLIMNGTLDAFMPFNGGTVLPGQGLVQSTAATHDFWRSFLGTNPVPVSVKLPDIRVGDESTVSSQAHCGGAEGTDVRLYTVKGGGHTIPSIAHPVPPSASFLGPQNRDVEGPVEIWRFLKQHSRTACGLCEAWDGATASCVAAPRSDCRRSTRPASSLLSVTDKSDDSRDKISWKWSHGEATGLADLSDPFSTSDYALCLYDESGMNPALLFRAVASGEQAVCGAPWHWAALAGGKGYKYLDQNEIPEGVFQLDLRTGDAGKARVAIKGAGENLSGRSYGMPTPPLSFPLRVQLQIEGGACFEASYSGAGALRNEPGRFKARADG